MRELYPTSLQPTRTLTAALMSALLLSGCSTNQPAEAAPEKTPPTATATAPSQPDQPPSWLSNIPEFPSDKHCPPNSFESRFIQRTRLPQSEQSQLLDGSVPKSIEQVRATLQNQHLSPDYTSAQTSTALPPQNSGDRVYELESRFRVALGKPPLQHSPIAYEADSTLAPGEIGLAVVSAICVAADEQLVTPPLDGAPSPTVTTA